MRRYMEATSSEPDAIELDAVQDTFLFCDCAPESPPDRRNRCCDGAALQARKASKPAVDAMSMALERGITMLSNEACRFLQQKGIFDTRTSSWIAAPDGIRRLSKALFCDYCCHHVISCHTSAESCYVSYGFRGSVRL